MENNAVTRTSEKKQRDLEWSVYNAKNTAEKSERIANFSIGFSVFTLVFILFVELVIKK